MKLIEYVNCTFILGRKYRYSDDKTKANDQQQQQR